MQRTQLWILASACLWVLFFFTSCSKQVEDQNESTTETKPEQVLIHKKVAQSKDSKLAVIKTSGKKPPYSYQLEFQLDEENERLFYKNNMADIVDLEIDSLKWAAKSYFDYKIKFHTKGQHRYGPGMGGWEMEYRFVELVDGKSGETYFKSEPYSYSFEEHNITGDTSHPLAQTSCFSKYRIRLFPTQNYALIDSLKGACLPDLEEGRYNFENNQLVLSKD